MVYTTAACATPYPISAEFVRIRTYIISHRAKGAKGNLLNLTDHIHMSMSNFKKINKQILETKVRENT